MRRTEALEAMVDRGLSHYDDVFELLGIYYNGGFESFSSDQRMGADRRALRGRTMERMPSGNSP